MYKNQLQELAQRSCFNLPSYACVREGPDHAPRFKVTVNFNGETFESPTFFSTLRQAEHAAAEVALNILADRGPSKTLAAKVLDETGVYKNLLQETAHRAGLNLPVYTTVRSGPGHVPIFLCTVDLAGMSFTGEPGKTKKQAQKNAAMAAWSSLKKMSQLGSSSSVTSSEGHEKQEQVIVARFLASLNPAESSVSPQNNQQKGHHLPPASPTYRKSFSSTPTSFGIRYQNWASTNLSPEMASHMWLQEQAAGQQRRLVGLPVPIPPPHQVVPWMHSMLQPSHHPYFLTGEQQPVPINSPFYFSNHVVPTPVKVRTMVNIQEIPEEKPEDSSSLFSPSLPLKDVVPSNISSKVVSNEKLKKEAEQKGLPQVQNITSASSELQEKGSPVFESSTPSNIRFSHATRRPNYHGNAGRSLPTASQGAPAGSTRGNSRTQISAPRMQSGVGSFPGRPLFGRTQTGNLAPRSPFLAPAVRIRSVVPVCSAAPPRRRTTGSTQEESSDNTRNRSSSVVSNVSSKLVIFKCSIDSIDAS